MKAIGNKVIIKPIMQDSTSEGGIIVPDSFKGRSAKGEVVAVGNKVSWLPVGSICHYVKGGGDKMEENGNSFYGLMDIDIRAYYIN